MGYWHQWADETFGDPPPRWIQEPSVVRDRDGGPPRGPSGSVLLLFVCSGSALLGDLLGVSRSRERDLLSVLSIYPRFFFCILCIVVFYSATC